LEPIENQKKDIESRLLLLDSYRKEYNEYSEKYEIINTLKKHSSPTAGGIQTFFMNLYMGKTLELANQLLGKLFNGQYQLLEYVITPDEFRMPFVGSGLVVDDITSGSTSQVCIMGMIINLSLLNQASTKFNITRLDEIDGGLDYNNRGAFIAILQEVIELLGIEQLFIISHNMESYNGGTDAIVLAPIDGLDDNSNGSHIIYHY
jgi:DNA repair exonuclease SbcCD ATPase subunit